MRQTVKSDSDFLSLNEEKTETFFKIESMIKDLICLKVHERVHDDWHTILFVRRRP